MVSCSMQTKKGVGNFVVINYLIIFFFFFFCNLSSFTQNSGFIVKLEDIELKVKIRY